MLTSALTPIQNAFSQIYIFLSGRVQWQPVIQWPLSFGRVKREPLYRSISFLVFSIKCITLMSKR